MEIGNCRKHTIQYNGYSISASSFICPECPHDNQVISLKQARDAIDKTIRIFTEAVKKQIAAVDRVAILKLLKNCPGELEKDKQIAGWALILKESEARWVASIIMSFEQ